MKRKIYVISTKLRPEVKDFEFVFFSVENCRPTFTMAWNRFYPSRSMANEDVKRLRNKYPKFEFESVALFDIREFAPLDPEWGPDEP